MIILGFPGIGKSWYVNKVKSLSPMGDSWAYNKVTDQDSSEHPRLGFPDNYVDRILTMTNIYEVVFASSHEEVVNLVVKSRSGYRIMYPNINLKDEYIERYKKRGNSEAFISLIDKNWDKWISHIEENHSEMHKIKLESGEYVNDGMRREIQKYDLSKMQREILKQQKGTSCL